MHRPLFQRAPALDSSPDSQVQRDLQALAEIDEQLGWEAEAMSQVDDIYRQVCEVGAYD